MGWVGESGWGRLLGGRGVEGYRGGGWGAGVGEGGGVWWGWE